MIEAGASVLQLNIMMDKKDKNPFQAHINDIVKFLKLDLCT